MLVDKFGRVHDYLRISVTDRCNLRCVYCMPEQGMQFLPHAEVLTDDEIVFVVETAASLGIRKLRFTGGEPLVRPNLERLVERTARIAGIEDIALSTNGILLAARSQDLRNAGVTRVNISLDSVNRTSFQSITRGGNVERVLAGIAASQAVGFDPIKLNVVLMKGVNDADIDFFLRWTVAEPICVRFIEYMPIGHADTFWRSHYLPLDSVLDRARAVFGEMAPVAAAGIRGNGPAEYFRLPSALGTFGLIHPVSSHFCAACNRLRLTADGHFKGCLFWEQESSVRDYIGDAAGLADLLQRVLAAKPENHQMANVLAGESVDETPTTRRMSQIGG